MAYRIQKDVANVEHVIYEKNEDIGGTWLENRYRQRALRHEQVLNSAQIPWLCLRYPISCIHLPVRLEPGLATILFLFPRYLEVFGQGLQHI